MITTYSRLVTTTGNKQGEHILILAWQQPYNNLITTFCVCWCYVLRWIWCLWCYSECASTPGKLKSWPDHSGTCLRICNNRRQRDAAYLSCHQYLRLTFDKVNLLCIWHHRSQSDTTIATINIQNLKLHKYKNHTYGHNRDLTILGRQRDGNGHQYNRSLKRIE
jgi:hypothetical protein